jgi:threonyl-tRNA synthetase
MRKIIKENIPLERFELPREEAIKYMESLNEPYKVELINDLPEDAAISFYRQGDFTDLCAGPHLMSTGRLKGNAIKLTSCTGAYWRGDSKRKMLQRIYGTCFAKKESWTHILRASRRLKGATTGSLERSSAFSSCWTRAPASPSSSQKGWC